MQIKLDISLVEHCKELDNENNRMNSLKPDWTSTPNGHFPLKTTHCIQTNYVNVYDFVVLVNNTYHFQQIRQNSGHYLCNFCYQFEAV